MLEAVTFEIVEKVIASLLSLFLFAFLFFAFCSNSESPSDSKNVFGNIAERRKETLHIADFLAYHLIAHAEVIKTVGLTYYYNQYTEEVRILMDDLLGREFLSQETDLYKGMSIAEAHLEYEDYKDLLAALYKLLDDNPHYIRVYTTWR